MKPPRALWVTFPLGRPLGTPNDPKFQTSVLKEALSLLEEERGPVLRDYPFDAEEDNSIQTSLACPVNFSTRPKTLTDSERLFEHFHSEIETMRTWYELARKQNTRSTTGVSGYTPQEIKELFLEFIVGTVDEAKTSGYPLPALLRMAAEDLKAYYFEAVSAQPGQSSDPAVLADWFWGETYAAGCINEVRKVCLSQDAQEMQLLGTLLLVPRSQMHRFV